MRALRIAMGLALSACVVNSSSKSEPTGSGGSDAASGANGATTNGGGQEPNLSSGGGGPADDGCDSVLAVTYRDFTEAHPDFEMPFAGDVVRLQLVEALLGADQRPVFRDSIGCPPDSNDPSKCANWTPSQPVIANADSFYQWFHDTDGTNLSFDKSIALVEDPPGSQIYVFDSSDFFPLAPNEGFGPSPAANNPNGKNFLFTSEIHVTFSYVAGQVFTFRGDDDLWIFVNGRLALDLGSMHLPAEGAIDFDAQAEALGLVAGDSYPMDIFQAERHTSGSNFRFETNISCFTPVDVPK